MPNSERSEHDGADRGMEHEWDGETVGINEFEIGDDDGLDEFLSRIGEEVSELVNEAGGRPAVVKFRLQVKSGELKRPSEGDDDE